MSVRELISRAEKAGYVFIVDGERVKYRLPKVADIKTGLLLDEIHRRREEIINFLRPHTAELARIRETWQRIFGIDVDAKRAAEGKSPLEDHLKDAIRPTPLADALLAEIEAMSKAAESPKRQWLPISEISESTEPGVTGADVFRIFGPSNFQRKDLANCREIWPRTMLTEADWQEAPEADQREILADATKWKMVFNRWEWERYEQACQKCGCKIIERVWRDGRRDRGCHGCGRKVT